MAAGVVCGRCRISRCSHCQCRESCLCDVHVRFDRPAQGGRGAAPRRGPPRDGPIVCTVWSEDADAASGADRVRRLDLRTLGPPAPRRHLRRVSRPPPRSRQARAGDPGGTCQLSLAHGRALQSRDRLQSGDPRDGGPRADRRRCAVGAARAQGALPAVPDPVHQRLRSHRIDDVRLHASDWAR